MSKFQFIVMSIFVVFIIVGVLAFATYKNNNGETQLPEITIWGTFPQTQFESYLSYINKSRSQSILINYVQKDESDFSKDFVAELARGRGPDAILISADMILPHMDKLALIPESALSKRAFQDSFIQEGEIYYTQGGVLGIPFSVDPLVMYWNRDMFSAAGIATYPRYWEEFTDLNKKLTVKDQNKNIRKSAIAMGDFTNLNHAREILGTLLFQIGNPVTQEDEYGIVQSTMNPGKNSNTSPAIDFFTKFVDPSSADYSWNRGMPQSKSAFLSGTLATYFGFASELMDIREKNQNLNFDVAPLPQVKTGGYKATYGKMYGLSITNISQNPNAAYQIIAILTNPTNLAELSNIMYLPTVSRSLIAQGSQDQYISIFNEIVLVARTWLDADVDKSRQLFGNMINNITSGKKTVFGSIQDTNDQYNIILRQVYQ